MDKYIVFESIFTKLVRLCSMRSGDCKVNMLIVLVETIIEMDIKMLIWNDIKKDYSFTEKTIFHLTYALSFYLCDQISFGQSKLIWTWP